MSKLNHTDDSPAMKPISSQRIPKPQSDIETVRVMPESAMIGEHLERQLIEMLSVLEFVQVRLEEQLEARNPKRALEQCLAIINHLIATADCVVDTDSFHRLTPVTRLVEDFHNRLSPVMDQVKGSKLQSLIGGMRSFAGRGTDINQKLLTDYRELVQLMSEIVVGYFIVFTQQFPTSKLSRNWVEAAAGFTVAIRQLPEKAIL
jgi:hypothetical protein